MPDQPIEKETTKVTLAELLARVEALEKEVAKLKCHLGDKSQWLTAVCGSMKDDPEFAEVLRLGREIRKSDFS